MSFGFGVGDFVTILQLANTLHERLAKAPKQFEALAKGVNTLSAVLDNVKDIDTKELPPEQEKKFNEISKDCVGVLEQLKGMLETHKELKKGPLAKRSISLMLQRTRKKFSWDQKEVDELQRRILLSISAFSLFLAQVSLITSSHIKAGVNHLRDQEDERKREQERKAIIDWLLKLGPNHVEKHAAQQDDFMGRFCEGTGKWLLESIEFREWLKQKDEMLFCTGMPGAGKTMISAAVVNYLLNNEIQQTSDGTVGVAFFYCNFRQQHEQKPIDVMTCLLQQFVLTQPSIHESVRRLYGENLRKNTSPLFKEISAVLHDVLIGFSKSYIVIDAMDEVEEGLRDGWLSGVLKLPANLFITSRPIPEIKMAVRSKKRVKSMTITATEEDIRLYLDSCTLPKCATYEPGLREKIIQEILEATTGMFLLARLYVASLEGCTTKKEIKTELQFMKGRKGSNAYNETYEHAMERLERLAAPRQQELAKRTFAWITLAQRPLAPEELRYALAVEVDESVGEDDEVLFDEDNITALEDILSVCTGLITVDDESGIIRYVHYTTQEYFERNLDRWVPNGRKHVAFACVTYLSTISGVCVTNIRLECRLRDNPLFRYAVQYWDYHVRETSTEEEKPVLAFLNKKVCIQATCEAFIDGWLHGEPCHRDEYEYCKFGSKIGSTMTSLHLTAFIGLDRAVKKLLAFENSTTMNTMQKSPRAFDIGDATGRTPLFWAAVNGHEAVVTTLLEAEADPNPEVWDGFAPLADVLSRCRSSSDIKRRTAYVEIAQKLIAAGADPNGDCRSNIYGTPLSRAAQYGLEEMMRILLAGGANPNIADTRKTLPIHWTTAMENHCDEDSKWSGVDWDAMTRMLIAAGAHLDAEGLTRRLQLHSIALFNFEEESDIVEKLISGGVDPNEVDSNDVTPLHLAAGSGNIQVLQKLLEARADPNLKTKRGRVPLHRAIERNYTEVVRKLMDAGADPTTQDNDGNTPSQLAKYYNNKKIINILEEYPKNLHLALSHRRSF